MIIQLKPKVYRGYRDEAGMHVTVNRRALRVVEYHADSFEWGYPGSGPATLALSILANYFNERWVNGEYLRRMKFAQAAPKCWHYHQEFKRDLITGLGRGSDDSWEISSDQIAKWLETQPAYEPQDVEHTRHGYGAKEVTDIAQQSYEQRRDRRFYSATVTALKDIEERALQLPQEQRYAVAYGLLRGYFESLLTNFAEAFSSDQLAEIRIVLDQLSKVTGEDEHLDEATRAKLDQLAQALRESGDTHE